MRSHDFRLSALVLTTTPPIPREYGNRNRVFQTIQFLKSLGFSISLLLYPFDEDWVKDIPNYYRELIEQFEYFAVIPNKRDLHRAADGYHHKVDEWWDDSIGDQLSWIFKRRRFDIFFVNYTFLSKAFEFAPEQSIRLLDTHDLFTGRRESFERHGVTAEFFYTNASEEKIAFDRSHAVIAIKESEAEFIRSITIRHVATVPYWAEAPKKRPQTRSNRSFSHESPLRLGFIGAQNSVNLVNIRRFLHRFERYVKLYNLPVIVIIAGNVCKELSGDYSFVRKLGRVANIENFYEQVDIIIAPLEFSTGIKIKVGEALAWELPVVATKNGFDGFRSFSSTQVEPSVASLCNTLALIATNEIPYSELIATSRRSARAAARSQEKGLLGLQQWIKNKMRRLIVISDRPFWYRGTYLDELIAQTIEYVSKIAPTIVVVFNAEEIGAKNVFADVEYFQCDGPEQFRAYLDTLLKSCRVDGTILVLDHVVADPIYIDLHSRGIPAWRLVIEESRTRHSVIFRATSSLNTSLTVAPLRYAPLQSAQNLDPTTVTIFRSENDSEWEVLVFRFIEGTCRELNLRVATIVVPPYAQYSASILRQSTQVASSRIILLGDDVVTQLFIPQVATYRGIRCLLVNADLVCPDFHCKPPSFPSLAESILAFLRGESSAHVASGANSGWATLWSSLNLV